MNRLWIAIRKQLAFFKRGFLIDSSYRVTFVIDLASGLLPIVSVFFLSRMLEFTHIPALERYNGDYFSFALIGTGLIRYFDRALQVFGTSIRRAQTSGVFEAVLSCKTDPAAVILYDATYSFASAAAHLALVLTAGLALGGNFKPAWTSALAVFLLSTAVFVALGVWSATFVTMLKNSDPVRLLFSTGAALLSGSLYPVEVLPSTLQHLAVLQPMTHSLDALRSALLQGASLSDVSRQVGILACFLVVLLPSGLWAFSRAIRSARKSGTLLHY